MNRRTFIKKFAVAASALAASSSVVLGSRDDGLEPVMPFILYKTGYGPETRFNPEWAQAPYELAVFADLDRKHYVPVIFDRSRPECLWDIPGRRMHDPIPFRFKIKL